jgi:membrane fusion protein (multidrug efflux system)
MAKLNRRKLLGLVLVLGAIVAVTAGWTWASAIEQRSTDNAYIRGDVTSIAPKVAGYVTALSVGDNQVVRAGDVLFRIDDRDYKARLAQASADVATARARLISVETEIKLQHALVRQAEAEHRAALAQHKLARIASDRGHKLIRSNAVGQEEVDERDAALSKAEAGVSAASATTDAEKQRIAVLETQREAAIAALAHAQAAEELAQIDLDDTVVRAPVDGVVGNRQVRVGRLVAPGMPLIDIVPVEDVWVVANFKETQVERIRVGQRAVIKVDGYPGMPIAGTVDSFAPGSGSAFTMLPTDNATGNFVRVVQRVPVKIRFVSNPLPGRIVPGLSARVEIDLGSGS